MSESLPRAALEGRIDGFLLRQIDPQRDVLPVHRMVPPITWNRFDLGFKLIWLDAYFGQETRYAEGLYERHIAAFSLGDMVEPGSDGKAGIARFRADFAALAQAIATHGFDAGQSLVPLAADGSLLNAGHRAACAIATGAEVTAVETGLEPKIFDHRFFAARGMAQADLDAAAIRLVEAIPGATVVVLGHPDKGALRAVERCTRPLLYRRDLALTLAGRAHLGQRLQARAHLPEPAPDLSGDGALCMLIFDAARRQGREAVMRALAEIPSRPHVSRDHAEAVALAHLLLNPNARHFLDHAPFEPPPQVREGLAALADYRRAQGLAEDAFAVDGGLVMGLYGLCPPGAIEGIRPVPLPDGAVTQSGQDSAEVAEILQDPARHFRVDGQIFTGLAELAARKRRGQDPRDLQDLALIEAFLQAHPVSGLEVSAPGAQGARFLWHRLRRSLIRVVMASGHGAALRRLYRRIAGRG